VQWLNSVLPERIKAEEFAKAHGIRVDDVKSLLAAGALSGSLANKLTGPLVDKHQPVVNTEKLVSLEEVRGRGPQVAAALGQAGAPFVFDLPLLGELVSFRVWYLPAPARALWGGVRSLSL
jgi:hypothetical protein